MVKTVKTVKKVAKKAVKKKVNRKGILALVSTLLADTRKYKQNTFGYTSSCGTVCCLAGHALAMEIGTTEFNKRVKNNMLRSEDCEDAGVHLLGLTQGHKQIFGTVSSWPEDLKDEYYNAKNSKQRVGAAIKALSRLLPDGKIDPDPKKIHTKIPLEKA